MKQDTNAVKMVKTFNKFIEAYHKAMQPICEETDLPPMAMDILMFLSNNPEYNTAKDICKYRGFKPGIVSFHVDNLVKYGYLVREDVAGDRRKYRLICTEKTKNVIEKGKKLQEKFAFAITKGLSDEDIKQFQSCLNIFEKNIEQIKKNGLEENE